MQLDLSSARDLAASLVKGNRSNKIALAPMSDRARLLRSLFVLCAIANRVTLGARQGAAPPRHLSVGSLRRNKSRSAMEAEELPDPEEVARTERVSADRRLLERLTREMGVDCISPEPMVPPGEAFLHFLGAGVVLS